MARKSSHRRRPLTDGKSPQRLLLSSGALALGASIAGAPSLDAATFNVTNLDDAGAGSLRQAILDANANAGADVVTFQSGLTGTITLTTGTLYVYDSVDIQGPGPADLTVSGNSSSQVFYIYQPGLSIDVTISGLTLTEGNSFAGGAISSLYQNVTLDDTVITGNLAFLGGGAAFLGGDLTITDSEISANYGVFGGGLTILYTNSVDVRNTSITGNTALGYGGGMVGYLLFNASTFDNVQISDNGSGGVAGGAFFYLAEDVTINESTISGNTGGFAAGLALVLPYGRAQILSSTISGNIATSVEGAAAGGLFFYGYAGAVLLQNATVSGNTASYAGGIFAALYYGGTVDIQHSTITGNEASETAGGLYVYGYGGTTTITNSIVSDSISPYGDVGNTDAINLSFSLIEDATVASFNDLGGNLFNVDPELGPLQNNGGPTETHLAALTSPVIGAGDPAFVPPPATDQRGFPREQPDGGLDMGSVELSPGTLQFAVAADSIAENGGMITISVTRTGGADGATSVDVNVSGGSATGGGTDYTFAGTTLNWADADSATKMFDVPITDDALFEGNETFVLQLATPAGAATLGSPNAETVTILDDDPALADLGVTKSIVESGPYEVGNNITFLITVTNAGPQSANNVVVDDTLPAEVSYVSATPSQGSCSGTVNVQCSLGTIANGANATVQIVVTLNAAGATSNTATGSANEADPDSSDDSGTINFTIAAAAATPAIPTLDPKTLAFLAATLAALSLGILQKR